MISAGWVATAALAKWWRIWTAPIHPSATACVRATWRSSDGRSIEGTNHETGTVGNFVFGLDRHDGGSFRRRGLRPGSLRRAENGGGAAGADGGGTDLQCGRGL